jgi:hypothetical protein
VVDPELVANFSKAIRGNADSSDEDMPHPPPNGSTLRSSAHPKQKEPSFVLEHESTSEFLGGVSIASPSKAKRPES